MTILSAVIVIFLLTIGATGGYFIGRRRGIYIGHEWGFKDGNVQTLVAVEKTLERMQEKHRAALEEARKPRIHLPEQAQALRRNITRRDLEL